MFKYGVTATILFFYASSAYAQCILTAGNVNLLSAQGLATPWVLSGACTQTDPNTQSFIEATVFEPAQGKMFAYSPLVIDAGTKPLVAPVVPNITAQAVIVYHFGCNANTLTLKDQTNGKTLAAAKCVNGAANSVFGQFAYCNGPAFFQAARAGAAGQIPPLGKALDGNPCPTTRSFALVDQDQSDNVITTYLVMNGQTAQNTAANKAKFPNAMQVGNPSDNALLSVFVDPAIGCTPFHIPALDDPGTARGTLAADELMAAAHQGNPVALVPGMDPMVLNNGALDLNKVNLYRAGVDQPPIGNKDITTAYCNNLATVGAPVILSQGPFTSKATTPAAATGTTLFTFLGTRFNMSWINLGCIALTGKQSPIVATLNGNGVGTALTFFINGKQIGPTTVGGNLAGSAISSMPSSTKASTTVASASSTKAASASSTKAASASSSKPATSVPSTSVVKTKTMSSAPASTKVMSKTMASAPASSAPASTKVMTKTKSAAPASSAPASTLLMSKTKSAAPASSAPASSSVPATTAAGASASASASSSAAAATTTKHHRHGRHHGRRAGRRRLANY